MTHLHKTLAPAAVALAAALGCESDDKREGPTQLSEEEVELREKAGLHPPDRVEPDPKTPEELKDEIDLHSEGKKPKSAEEMRDEMNLHPERVEGRQ